MSFLNRAWLRLHSEKESCEFTPRPSYDRADPAMQWGGGSRLFDRVSDTNYMSALAHAPYVSSPRAAQDWRDKIHQLVEEHVKGDLVWHNDYAGCKCPQKSVWASSFRGW
jgi:hypothetical protein